MLSELFTKRLSILAASIMSAALVASCTTAPTETATDSGETAADETATEEATCAADIAQLDFGIISTESQENLKPLWEPFLDAMEAELGRPVNGFYATDYAGVIEAMGANKVQLAWYGGKSYIEAAARSNAEAFAQTVATDGSKGYYSYLITNVENPIVNEIDLEAGDGDKFLVENSSELTFAFNDPNSTSGYLVPMYYVFAQNGLNPDSAFEELIFAGSHEATAQAVANNQVDIATNNSESLVRLQESDPAAAEKVQVIWTSPVIPSDPISYRNDLPECLKDQIKDFFFTFDDESVLGPLQWQGFDPAGDEDWNTIRELEIAKNILEVQNDDSLSDEDKQAQIDELNKQLEALQ